MQELLFKETTLILKNNKTILITCLIILIVSIIYILTPQTKTVTIKNAKVKAEIANTTPKRTTGLMNRIHLDQNKGMLFVFDNAGTYPFWMQNTLIPLDIIWISEDYKVLYIQSDARPCKEQDPKQIDCPLYVPAVWAKYVLEVNSGWSVKNDVSIGDVVVIGK